MFEITRGRLKLSRDTKPVAGADTAVEGGAAVLKQYLDDANPGSALLISGEWGAGKTYFLMSHKETIETLTRKSLVVVSVAGLSTREELDQALFLASAPWLFSGYTQAVGVFFKAGLRFAKIDPKDFKFSADFRSGKVAVVLEDVDRFSGDIRTLFGLVIDLVDQSHLHTVLVAAEDALLEKNDFGSWKERIVGITVQVRPNIAAMVDDFVSEIPSSEARTRLKSNIDLLISVAEDWGLNNLRALRYAIKELSRVIGSFDQNFDRLGAVEAPLLGGLFLGLLEIKRNAGSAEAVAKVFSHDGLSETALARLMGIGVGTEDEADDTLFVTRLIQRYPNYPFQRFPGGSCFRDFFQLGVVNPDAILSAFEPQTVVESLRERFLRDYLSLGQGEFDGELRKLMSDLSEGRIASMAELGRIYLVLVALSDRKAIKLAKEEVAKLVIDAATSVSAEDVLDDNSDDDDFWFIEKRDDVLREVQEVLNERRRAAAAAKTERERLSLFTNVDESFVSKLQHWRAEPLFVDSPERFLSEIWRLQASQIQDLIRFFWSRRAQSGFAAKLHSELSTLREMSALISTKIPAEGTLSITESQMFQLKEAIDNFTQELKAYRGAHGFIASEPRRSR